MSILLRLLEFCSIEFGVMLGACLCFIPVFKVFKRRRDSTEADVERARHMFEVASGHSRAP